MKQNCRGCSVRVKCLINATLLATIMLSTSVTSYAAELPPLTHNLTTVKSSAPAPLLRLQNMDETTVDIRELKGKVVVINFWATWCPPCRREMGSLERLRAATADKNVVILAINIGEDMDTVFSFLGTVEPFPGFPILFDPDGGSMKDWKVHGLPTTFILHPDGSIAYKAVGGREFDHADIQQAILNLRKP